MSDGLARLNWFFGKLPKLFGLGGSAAGIPLSPVDIDIDVWYTLLRLVSMVWKRKRGLIKVINYQQNCWVQGTCDHGFFGHLLKKLLAGLCVGQSQSYVMGKVRLG